MNLDLCAVIRCIEMPFLEEPLPLCRQHALAVSLNVTDRLHANALAGSAFNDLDVEQANVAPDSAWQRPSHPPVVYFLTNGDRVKIGTSTNITARVSALSLRKSNAALLLEGDKDLETALHDHFECDRIARTEWFVYSLRIREYIERRQAEAATTRQPQLLIEGTREEAAEAQVVRVPTAEERILEVLLGSQSGTGCEHVHRSEIGRRANVRGSTLDNTLSRLADEGTIHRGPVRGTYGFGSAE